MIRKRAPRLEVLRTRPANRGGPPQNGPAHRPLMALEAPKTLPVLLVS